MGGGGTVQRETVRRRGGWGKIGWGVRGGESWVILGYLLVLGGLGFIGLLLYNIYLC